METKTDIEKKTQTTRAIANRLIAEKSSSKKSAPDVVLKPTVSVSVPSLQKQEIEEELQTKPLGIPTKPWLQKQRTEEEVPFPEGASSGKTPWIQRATNPDGVELGPTDRSRSFCERQTLWATTTTQNTPTRARGIQTVWFKGNNTGTNDSTVNCSCGCGLYRHWIRGYWRNAPGGPKLYNNVNSCGTNITINETTWTEEYTTCFGDNDTDACDWEYADHPGWRSGLSDGRYVELHFEFKYQIWDTCNNRSVAQARRTLDISGDTHPRTITWSTP